MIRVMESIGQDIEEAGRISLHTPLVGGISLSEIPMALYKAGILLPAFAAQLVLRQPGTLVPDEQ